MWNSFQDKINRYFLDSLEYLTRISPKRVEEHIDTCESLCYKRYKHYPNYIARRIALSIISDVKTEGDYYPTKK